MHTGGCETKVERTHVYQQYGLFAVFDGHNGQMSSDALHAGLYVAVCKQPNFHQAPDKVKHCQNQRYSWGFALSGAGALAFLTNVGLRVSSKLGRRATQALDVAVAFRSACTNVSASTVHGRLFSSVTHADHHVVAVPRVFLSSLCLCCRHWFRPSTASTRTCACGKRRSVTQASIDHP